MKTVTIRMSEDILRDLDIYADVFASSRSELIRNWIEDVLYFLKNDILEVDRKRHLVLKRNINIEEIRKDLGKRVKEPWEASD